MMNAPAYQPQSAQIRQRLQITGIVQGVGFRPWVYGLAQHLKLHGFVQNDSTGVLVEVQGSVAAVTAFTNAIHQQPPPLARIDHIQTSAIAVIDESSFVIRSSQTGAAPNTLIAPDTGICGDCLRELFDKHDRRFRYPFINCTNCGPRFTIVADIPYDRAHTSMRLFPMCLECQAEYDDPTNRRFHAQPNACHVCGPQVHLIDMQIPSALLGEREAAIQQAGTMLAKGQILAVKGLGGYHLACDAWNTTAVQALRQRKQREAKPFAVMVANLAAAQQLCHLSPEEAALLESHRRPIVVMERRTELALPAAIAPGHTTLGVMLAYTPLHHLLLAELAAYSPAYQPPVLVMTSGNRSDEPIAYREPDVYTQLAGIADAVLIHNRMILTRCDDSVVRIVDQSEQFLRRSRGYAPEPLVLTMCLPRSVMAYGAHLKNTFCLARGSQAFVSHHIGDLENIETLSAFREGIVHYQHLFGIVPEVLAYDLHPEYLATKEALHTTGIPAIGVQHHHAHIASVIAEHGIDSRVIGVAADGTGYGSDGTIWGGEILLADLHGFERYAHLATFALPGGEQAIRQPWRVAASLLQLCYGEGFIELELPFIRQLDRNRWRVLAQMLVRGVNSPQTSSIGRLFDAVAALIGLRQEVLYEGQAAIELEQISSPHAQPYPYVLHGTTPMQIDPQPMLRAIVADLQASMPTSAIASRFHATMAACLAESCQYARAASGLNTVALSGGVFQNRLLLQQLRQALSSAGFEVYTNQRVPPNDGGISLGQAAVAGAQQ